MLTKRQYGFPDMFTMAFKTSPFFSLVYAAKIITDALLPTFSIFVRAHFINTALAVYNRTADISAVYMPVFLLALMMFYNSTINAVMSMVDCNRNILFRKKLVPEMTDKIARLKYRHIENPKTADLINRTCPPFDKNVWEMYTAVLGIVNIALFILGTMAALFTQVWWIAVTMFIVNIPVMYIATMAGRQSYEADKEMTKIDRRADYLSEVLKQREAVEERNMFGYTERLNAQFSENFEFARKFRLKITRKNFIRQKSGGVVTTVYAVAAMLALLPPVINGSITIGMFIALIGGVIGLSQRLSWGVNWQIEDLTRKREYLTDLTDFMQLDEHGDAAAKPAKNMSFKKIEFKNVSFAYPDTDKMILNGVSFTIEYGKHYSFVGVNGAGKTTITKLITGLYDNYEGEILVDGRPLRDLSQSEIKGLSSVVYQDFAKYYISFRDNISVANLDGGGNTDEIENAVKLVGLSEAAEKLKDGLDTPLGKILEDGVDLSGGEWQRAAMARSVLSTAPLKILDEPTAALDPIGESMVYNSFDQISRGMTTIFISHRLGSTKLADIIYVISDGKIIESGSHTELMDKNGVYCEMFNSQAEWYSGGNGEAAEGGAVFA